LKDRIDIINKLAFLLLDYDMKRSNELCHEAISLSHSGIFSDNTYIYGITTAKMNLGNSLMLTGRYEESLELSKELFLIIENNDEYHDLFINLLIVYGVSLFSINDTSGALENILKAMA